MKSINNSFNGLASSLLLNLGLPTLAEKFDPMQNQAGNARNVLSSADSCTACVPCYFTSEVGQ